MTTYPVSFALIVANFVLCAINLVWLRRQYLMFRQWMALNHILVYLCVGAFVLRTPRLRHILEVEIDDEPEPEPRRRFWQRRAPKT